MRNAIFLILMFVTFSQLNLAGQIILNEVAHPEDVEIINISDENIEVNEYYLYYGGDKSQKVGRYSPVCPYRRTELKPGELMYVNEDLDRSSESGFVALFSSNDFTDQDALLSYVQWGESGQELEAMAVAKGLWVEGDFVPFILPNGSIEFDGEGLSASDWKIEGVHSLCEENGTSCDLYKYPAQLIDIDTAYYCIGDGRVTFSSGFSGNSSENVSYVILDKDSTILDIDNEGYGSFTFDSIISDTLFLYLFSYDGSTVGLEIGKRVPDIIGCYVLSEDPMPIVFTSIDAGMVTLKSGSSDTTLCS